MSKSICPCSKHGIAEQPCNNQSERHLCQSIEAPVQVSVKTCKCKLYHLKVAKTSFLLSISWHSSFYHNKLMSCWNIRFYLALAIFTMFTVDMFIPYTKPISVFDLQWFQRIWVTAFSPKFGEMYFKSLIQRIA